MMNIDVTICLALVVPDIARVNMASQTKLVPPMKSVSFSNEAKGEGEPNELIGDGDQNGDSEVVVIQDMDGFL